ncbi:MAG: XRE family transcriptional regulator [Magnetococcales bacterium]|nr:XRE family transcriptional regulator [Magnetococcales bacterium]
MRRNGRLIRAWMVLNNIKNNDVAKMAGLTSPIVSRTIHGEKNNARVLSTLKEMGCPVKILAFPGLIGEAK